jgi:hypothetical protein
MTGDACDSDKNNLTRGKLLKGAQVKIPRKKGAKLQISGARAEQSALRNKCLTLVSYIDDDTI